MQEEAAQTVCCQEPDSVDISFRRECIVFHVSVYFWS